MVATHRNVVPRRTAPPNTQSTVRRHRRSVCTLIAVALLAGGCATQKYTPTSDAAAREIKLKAGDSIRVATTRRERFTLEVTEVRADRFVGVTVAPYPKDARPGGQTVEVLFDELAVLHVTRFDAGALAIASAVALVTVSALGVVIGAAAVPAVPPVVP